VILLLEHPTIKPGPVPHIRRVILRVKQMTKAGEEGGRALNKELEKLLKRSYKTRVL
jgi:hypothetical protein